MVFRSLGLPLVGAMSLFGCNHKPPPPPPPSHTPSFEEPVIHSADEPDVELWAKRPVFIPIRLRGQNNCKMFDPPSNFADVDFHLDGSCHAPGSTSPRGSKSLYYPVFSAHQARSDDSFAANTGANVEMVVRRESMSRFQKKMW